MSHSTKPPSAVRMQLAVQMRRCGSTWRAVGMELGCSPETVRQWPRVYPLEWQAAVRAGVKQSAAKAEGGTIAALQMMMQSGTEKVRLRAARSLIEMKMGRKRAEIAAKSASFSPGGWRISVLALLEDRSHDELKSLGEYCLQLAMQRRNSTQPGRSGSV